MRRNKERNDELTAPTFPNHIRDSRFASLIAGGSATSSTTIRPTRMQRFRQKTATLADSTRSAFDLFFEVFIPGLLLGDYFQAVYDSLPGLARRASGSSSLRPPSKMYSVAAKGGADERRSYREWLSAVFWAVLLGSIGIYCIDVAFFNPGLTLPSSASYQLFYDTHPFEVWDMKYSPMFTTASVAGVKYYIQWWFGIEGTATAGTPRARGRPGFIQWTSTRRKVSSSFGTLPRRSRARTGGATPISGS